LLVAPLVPNSQVEPHSGARTMREIIAVLLFVAQLEDAAGVRFKEGTLKAQDTVHLHALDLEVGYMDRQRRKAMEYNEKYPLARMKMSGGIKAQENMLSEGWLPLVFNKTRRGDDDMDIPEEGFGSVGEAAAAKEKEMMRDLLKEVGLRGSEDIFRRRIAEKLQNLHLLSKWTPQGFNDLFDPRGDRNQDFRDIPMNPNLILRKINLTVSKIPAETSFCRYDTGLKTMLDEEMPHENEEEMKVIKAWTTDLIDLGESFKKFLARNLRDPSRGLEVADMARKRIATLNRSKLMAHHFNPPAFFEDTGRIERMVQERTKLFQVLDFHTDPNEKAEEAMKHDFQKLTDPDSEDVFGELWFDHTAGLVFDRQVMTYMRPETMEYFDVRIHRFFQSQLGMYRDELTNWWMDIARSTKGEMFVKFMNPETRKFMDPTKFDGGIPNYPKGTLLYHPMFHVFESKTKRISWCPLKQSWYDDTSGLWFHELLSKRGAIMLFEPKTRMYVDTTNEMKAYYQPDVKMFYNPLEGFFYDKDDVFDPQTDIFYGQKEKIAFELTTHTFYSFKENAFISPPDPADPQDNRWVQYADLQWERQHVTDNLELDSTVKLIWRANSAGSLEYGIDLDGRHLYPGDQIYVVKRSKRLSAIANGDLLKRPSYYRKRLKDQRDLMIKDKVWEPAKFLGLWWGANELSDEDMQTGSLMKGLYYIRGGSWFRESIPMAAARYTVSAANPENIHKSLASLKKADPEEYWRIYADIKEQWRLEARNKVKNGMNAVSLGTGLSAFAMGAIHGAMKQVYPSSECTGKKYGTLNIPEHEKFFAGAWYVKEEFWPQIDFELKRNNLMGPYQACQAIVFTPHEMATTQVSDVSVTYHHVIHYSEGPYSDRAQGPLNQTKAYHRELNYTWQTVGTNRSRGYDAWLEFSLAPYPWKSKDATQKAKTNFIVAYHNEEDGIAVVIGFRPSHLQFYDSQYVCTSDAADVSLYWNDFMTIQIVSRTPSPSTEALAHAKKYLKIQKIKYQTTRNITHDDRCGYRWKETIPRRGRAWMQRTYDSLFPENSTSTV